MDISLRFVDFFFAILPLFFVGLLGFFFRRGGRLSPLSDETLSWLVLNLFTPCLIVDSFLGNKSLDNVDNLLMAPILGFCTVLIGISFCRLAGRFFQVVTKEQQGTFDVVVSLYNYGYIPIPIILLFFNIEVLGMLFVYNVGLELAVWTIGVIELSGHSSWREAVKRTCTPPLIALALALLANGLFEGNPLPLSVVRVVHMIGQATIPTALLLVGAMIFDHFPAIKKLSSFRPLCFGVVLRLLVIPITFVLMATFLPIDASLKTVLCVQAGMPSAVLPMVLIRQFGGDLQLATQIILATSVLCLITLPVWLSVVFGGF